MARILSLAVFVVAVCYSQAFDSREDIIVGAEGREIDEECLAMADQGDCSFYLCFEDRFPCGADWHILKNALYYCLKINDEKETFPESTQLFLRDSQRCLMQTLKDEYQQDSLSCRTVENNAIQEVSTCFRDSAFCTNLIGNYEQLFQLYEKEDLVSTSAGRIWREIAELAIECGDEALLELTSFAVSRVSEGLNDLLNSARDQGNSISEAVDDAIDSVRDLADDAERVVNDVVDSARDHGNSASRAVNNVLNSARSHSRSATRTANRAVNTVRRGLSSLFGGKKK